MAVREELVESPDGVTYVVRVEPAQRWDRNPFGRRRLLPLLRRDRSWWVTVESSEAHWAVLRESWPTEPDARDRVVELVEALGHGTLRLPSWPPPIGRTRPEGSPW
jgi:hypothetical protein